MTDVLLDRFTAHGRALAGAGATQPLVQYQRDPVGFLRDVLGVPERTIRWSLLPEYAAHTWDGTPDPLARMFEAVADGSDVGVESATGTGKTFGGACLMYWFLGCFEDAIVVTSAPIEDQLRLHIWKEAGTLWPRFQAHFPGAQLLDLKVRVRSAEQDAQGGGPREKWAATGFKCGVDAGAATAVRAQGFHARHMLIITEETPGIHPAIMEAFENTCTADHNIRVAFGNPDHQQDALHQFCLQPGTEHIRISALDHPNVVTGREIVPGAVMRRSIARRLKRYKTESHPLYRSRVRGFSPAEAQNALIKLEWCHRARDRWKARMASGRPVTGVPAWGVDVANSEGGDEGAVARGIGNLLREVEAAPCPDANELGARVVAEIQATPGGSGQHAGFDSVGVGAGAVNEAKRLRCLVKALNGGERAWPTVDEDEDVEPGKQKVTNAEKYVNLRAQMHWQMAQDLMHDRVDLPDDEELFQDLIAPTWEPRNGKILVESKEDIKARLKRSPNKGDAAVYWNWVRDRTVVVEEPPDPRPFDPDVLKAEVEAKTTMRGRKQRQRQNTPNINDYW